MKVQNLERDVARRVQISYVKVQNLERDVARRAQISETTGPCEAPEASLGPEGPDFGEFQ